MQKVRVVFVGTAEFGIESLKVLTELEFVDLVGIVTQPDKPAGRKKILKSSPVKEFSQLNLPDVKILQPESIREASQQIVDELKPDLVLVAAYGQIIPKELLQSPRFGCLNLHGSLLPKLRGAVPVQMAILQGFKRTGVTMQKMVSKMDAGPIVSTREHMLSGKETTQELMGILGDLAAQLIAQDLQKWISGELIAVEQDESKATYCYMSDISKGKAEITYYTKVELAERMIRAFTPWPIAWFRYGDGHRIKIYRANIHKRSIGEQIMGLKKSLKLYRDKEHLILRLRDGELSLVELQKEGKRAGGAKEHLYLVERDTA